MDYKFRYTLGESQIVSWEKQYQPVLNEIFSYLTDNIDMEFTLVTIGFEKLNKLNQPTHPHVHIHFRTELSVGTLRKRFQRRYKLDDRKGNPLYCLTQEEDVQDEQRFYRYPWKQGGRIKRLEKIPAEWDTKVMLACAQEEQVKQWDTNKKAEEKRNQPSTKDKLFEYLDAMRADLTDEKSIFLKVCEYYNQEEKSANMATIKGYIQTALWRYELETFEETFSKIYCIN